MNMISTAILKVLVDTFTLRNTILKVSDVNGELDSNVATAFKNVLGSNAMFIGSSEWAFGHDATTSTDYDLHILNDGAYPLAMLLEKSTVTFNAYTSFLGLIQEMLEEDLDFKETEDIRNLPSFHAFKAYLDFNPLYPELIDEITEDAAPLYLYLSMLEFQPTEFAKVLQQDYKPSVASFPTTEAYGLNIPSADIINANEAFKVTLQDLPELQTFDIEWGGEILPVEVSTVPVNTEDRAHGIYIRLQNITFRMYAGVRMSDSVNQPGITLARRLNPDLPWEYENVVRSTCVNVSPFHAIYKLMENTFTQKRNAYEKFSYAAFQVLCKLNLSYGQTLENYDEYRTGITYDDYCERNAQFIQSESDSV